MKSLRRIHALLGVLFAPSLLLSLVSGTLQMFGFHEGEDGDEPSTLVVRMAMIHTHQTPTLPRHRPPRPEAPAAPAPTPAPPPPRPPGTFKRPTTMPLKIFFTAMCLSLLTSTFVGLYIAFTSKRDRMLHGILLAAGVILPVVLMLL